MVLFFKAWFLLGFLFFQPLSTPLVAGLLLVMTLNITREKYWFSLPTLILEGLLVLFVSQDYYMFSLLYAFVLLDSIRLLGYLAIPFGLFLLALNTEGPNQTLMFLLLFLAGSLGVWIRKSEDETRLLQRSLDKERYRRYEVEALRDSLIQSSEEMSHVAEVTERNRIARALHDILGHSLAGIYLQLQAAEKLQTRDFAKSQALLHEAVTRLGSSMELLRNTVHNLTPKEKIGLEQIEEIVEGFQFCKISFSHQGDWQEVPSNYTQIMARNIKEALTNAAKYSNATEILIHIEITPTFLRLYIKDNGVGCANIKEGLGLSGLRERMKSVQGSLSISAEEGFLLVCFFPLREGRKIIAGVNRG